MELKEIGPRILHVAKLIKIKSPFEKPSDSPIVFEVDPAFGIKVLPFAQVKV